MDILDKSFCLKNLDANLRVERPNLFNNKQVNVTPESRYICLSFQLQNIVKPLCNHNICLQNPPEHIQSLFCVGYNHSYSLRQDDYIQVTLDGNFTPNLFTLPSQYLIPNSLTNLNRVGSRQLIWVYSSMGLDSAGVPDRRTRHLEAFSRGSTALVLPDL